ncbi:MAG: hypothetical protein DRN96_02620 [Thermoproteota archaeon]|nr:MAG: hypothetical protein DRN96_02620 [Candidatus Korarchaeota archaeon]
MVGSPLSSPLDMLANPVGGGLLLILGPPGSGKSTLVKRYLAEGLAREEPCLAAVVDEPPHRFELELQGHVKVDLSEKLKEGLLHILDFFTWRGGVLVGDMRYKPVTTLDAIIAEAEATSPWRMAVDSITTLAFHFPADSVWRFLDTLRVKAALRGNSIAATLEQGVHSKSFQESLRHIADYTLELKVEERRVLWSEQVRRYVRLAVPRQAQVGKWIKLKS